MKYHIDKKGQNYIDKEALTKWMEEAAVASQIGHDYIPFVKETKGENLILCRNFKNLGFVCFKMCQLFRRIMQCLKYSMTLSCYGYHNFTKKEFVAT